MNVSNIKQMASRGTLVIRKWSPEIMVGAGVVGVVGSTILACRATLKLGDVIDEREKTADIINTHGQKFVDDDDTDYTEKDLAKDKTIAMANFVGNIAKLYWPSFTLGVASIGCIIGGHNILRKRNIAIVSAYKLAESTFTNYRSRVVESLGSEKDIEFLHGVKEFGKSEEVSFKDPKSGDEKKVTLQEFNVTDPNKISKYAKFFDDNNANWERNSESNLLFLTSQQQYANNLLHANGHIFLNEVYDMLGIPRTSAGQVVGWVLNHGGDNFVSFGIYDNPSNPVAHAFVNGEERSILLDFNVDGLVYDLI